MGGACVVIRCAPTRHGVYTPPMGQFGPLLTSGEGHADLGANVLVQDVLSVVVTMPPKGRLIGNQNPRGVWHIGQWGIGYFAGDSVDLPESPISVYSYFVHLEREDHYLPISFNNSRYAPSVWWRWTPGTEVELTVFF